MYKISKLMYLLFLLFSSHVVAYEISIANLTRTPVEVKLVYAGCADRENEAIAPIAPTMSSDQTITYDLTRPGCILRHIEIVNSLQKAAPLPGKAAYFLIQRDQSNEINITACDKKTMGEAISRVLYTEEQDIMRFMNAIERDDQKLIAFLLAQKRIADLLAQKNIIDLIINGQDAEGKTALLKAVERKSTYSLETLLKLGASVSIGRKDGVTPLMVAARENWVEGAKLLIANGADINHQDKEKKTALMYAADRRLRYNLANHLEYDAAILKYDTVKLLLESGADPRKLDQNGHDAYYYLLQRGWVSQTDDLKNKRLHRPPGVDYIVCVNSEWLCVDKDKGQCLHVCTETVNRYWGSDRD